MLLGIGRKSNHGVIASMGLEMSPQNHSFFSVACAKKPSSCRCILASEKYSAGVEVLAMWEGRLIGLLAISGIHTNNGFLVWPFVIEHNLGKVVRLHNLLLIPREPGSLRETCSSSPFCSTSSCTCTFLEWVSKVIWWKGGGTLLSIELLAILPISHSWEPISFWTKKAFKRVI